MSSQHRTTQHNTTQNDATHHNTTQHNTARHNTASHNTAQHNTTHNNTTRTYNPPKNHDLNNPKRARNGTVLVTSFGAGPSWYRYLSTWSCHAPVTLLSRSCRPPVPPFCHASVILLSRACHAPITLLSSSCHALVTPLFHFSVLVHHVIVSGYLNYMSCST